MESVFCTFTSYLTKIVNKYKLISDFKGIYDEKNLEYLLRKHKNKQESCQGWHCFMSGSMLFSMCLDVNPRPSAFKHY